MNDNIKKFIKEKIKDDLKLLPNSWIVMFRRMYSHKNPEADINDIIDGIPVDNLDRALTQVEISLSKLKNKKGT